VEGQVVVENKDKSPRNNPEKHTPLNEEKGNRTLTTDHLADRLSGRPKPGQNGNDKDTA
jgi:hypothetical protein